MTEYFNTPVIWHKTGPEDKFAQPTEQNTVKIKVYLESGFKRVRDPKGDEVTAEYTITTDQKIGPADKIEIGGKVMQILNYHDLTDFDGKFIFRELYL